MIRTFFKKTVQNNGATAQLPRLEGLEGSQAHIVEKRLTLQETVVGNE